MSKSALSATVQAHILKRVRQQADDLFAKTPLVINKDGKEVFNPKSPISLEQIRTETNPNQEASISRGGLQTLANNFLVLQDKNVLAKDAFLLLSKETLFDSLANFLLQKINKEETPSAIKSRSMQFTYTGLRASADTTTAKFAKSKGTSPEDRLKDVVLVNNIAHGKFNEYFIEYLRSIGTSSKLVDFIKDNIDTGHLTGVFNIKLQRIFGLKIAQKNRANYRSMSVNFSDANQELNDLFQRIMLLVSDADYLSSNIVHNLELFSNTTKIIYGKSGPVVSVEVQLSLLNQEIGRKLAATSGYLNKLMQAARTTAVKADALTAGKQMQKFIESLKPLADEVKKVAELYKDRLDVPPQVQQIVQDILEDNQTIQRLVTTEGSDPVLDSIVKIVGLTLDGKTVPSQNTSTSKDKSISKLKSATKKPKVSVKVAKPKSYNLGTINKGLSVPESAVSLVRLQNLFNSNLHDQIKANMGTGDRQDVLNYRTGRFAESARVERISESRQGMITAFYTYMKNPYATFSKGGRQQMPASRDPKLLISKSIRELAGPSVSNRMRAVLV